MKSTPRVNKTKWIQEKPTTMPAKDVVEAAKKAGISLSLAQVYTARSTAKKKGESVGAGAGEKRKRGRPPGSGRKGSNGHGDAGIKEEFVKLAMRIGTDEAGRLLDRLVAQQQQL